MSAPKFVLAILLTALSTPLMAAPPPGGPIPEKLAQRATPEGIQTIDEPGGGRILHGALTGVTSGQDAFTAALQRLRGYFDRDANLLQAVRSKDGNTTLVAFTGVLHNEPVGGLGMTVYDPNGNSRVYVVFDDVRRLSKTLQPMVRHVDSLTTEMIAHNQHAASNSSDVPTAPGASGRSGASAPSVDFSQFQAASHHVNLTRKQFPDHTGSIGIASGFTPETMSLGTFFAKAADGAYIRLGQFAGISDTHGSLYQSALQLAHNIGRSTVQPMPGRIFMDYESDPVSAWKKLVAQNARLQNVADPNPQIQHSAPVKCKAGWTGRLVSGTMTLHDETFDFTGLLMTTPPPDSVGSWGVTISILSAPARKASTDMPAMIAMRGSLKVDMKAVQGQVAQNIQAMNEQSAHFMATTRAAGEAQRNSSVAHSMANARATQDSIDRSAAGFIHYINGTDVVQSNTTGARGSMDSNLASALAKSDPQHFTVVPMNQYRKGSDY